MTDYYCYENEYNILSQFESLHNYFLKYFNCIVSMYCIFNVSMFVVYLVCIYIQYCIPWVLYCIRVYIYVYLLSHVRYVYCI